jgi:hypothetical protein
MRAIVLAQKPYKITYRRAGKTWRMARRRKSLQAALCAARGLSEREGVTHVKVWDGRTGREWSVGRKESRMGASDGS